MKKKIYTHSVFIVLMFTSNLLFAQNPPTIVDLQNLSVLNGNDFDTKATNAGYSLWAKVSDGVTKVYRSDNENPQGKRNTISRSAIGDSFPTLGYSTTEKRYYLAWKNELSKLGYRFTNQEEKPVNDKIFHYFYYKSSKYLATIYIFTSPDDETWYNVHIHP